MQSSFIQEQIERGRAVSFKTGALLYNQGKGKRWASKARSGNFRMGDSGIATSADSPDTVWAIGGAGDFADSVCEIGENKELPDGVWQIAAIGHAK